MYTYLSVFAVYLFLPRGGPAYVLQPTFGYLIGFLIGTVVTGLIVHKVPRPSIKRLLVANFSGLLIVYTLGTITTSIANVLHEYLCRRMVFVLILFLTSHAGDILTCVVCAFIGKRLVPILKKGETIHMNTVQILKEKALQGVSITKEEALSSWQTNRWMSYVRRQMN